MAKQEKSIYEIIKKQNGERFAKAVRNYDNGIFDVPNIVEIVKFAGREAEPIMAYLVSLKDIQIEEHAVHFHPLDLLKKAGYNAYYADTLQKQNAIRKYFASGEALCTFTDAQRYKNYHIINCVKENVDEIKRENFKSPQREDEYGTSVISIQIAKGGGFISIKNRYNHIVSNPDNTLNSNPDNIIKGLSASLKHFYHVDFASTQVNLPNNFTLIGNQIIKYHYELNDVYFGNDFYAKEGKIHQLDKRKEMMLDYFVFDLHSKILRNPADVEDGFVQAFAAEIKDKKLQVTINEQGNKCLELDGVPFLELSGSKIVAANFEEVREFGDRFLSRNQALKSFNAPKAETFGDRFLYNNTDLTSFNALMAETFGSSFLYNNRALTSFNAPKAETFGSGVLYNNKALTSFSAPMAETFGHRFLYNNTDLTSFNAPKAETFGDRVLFHNRALTSFNAPEAKTFGDCFLYDNEALSSFSAPMAETFGDYFLYAHPQSKVIRRKKSWDANNNKIKKLAESLSKRELPENKAQTPTNEATNTQPASTNTKVSIKQQILNFYKRISR